jgi:hypothetical protein
VRSAADAVGGSGFHSFVESFPFDGTPHPNQPQNEPKPLFTEEVECFYDEDDDDDEDDETIDDTGVDIHQDDDSAPTLFKKSDTEALMSFCK